MNWKTPHIIKIYEALWALADTRIEVIGNTAKVYSSSRWKYYEVIYDPEKQALMCNDNASYYNETLGYPAITFLIEIWVFDKNQSFDTLLRDISWKDINQKNNNDYEKTCEYVYSLVEQRWWNRDNLIDYASWFLQHIKDHPFWFLGQKIKPPDWY